VFARPRRGSGGIEVPPDWGLARNPDDNDRFPATVLAAADRIRPAAVVV